MRAIWRGALQALSDHAPVIDGHCYLPPESGIRQHLRESPTTSVCPWKAAAHYYDAVVDGLENRDAAWYYPTPKQPPRK